MNEQQKKVMWIVLVIITLMALFPIKEVSSLGVRGRTFLYANESTFGAHTTSANVDLETTIAQMIPIITIGAGLFIFFKDRKSN